MNSFLGLGFLFAILFLKTLIDHNRAFKAFKKEIKAVKESFEEYKLNHHLLVNADLSFAKQINDINAQLISMDNQLQNLENKRDNDGGYQHALRILDMGGDKDEIMTNCHLSQAEADLLMNLSAYRQVIKKQSSDVEVI